MKKDYLNSAPNGGELKDFQDDLFYWNTYRLYFERHVSPALYITRVDAELVRECFQISPRTFAKIAIWFLWRWIVFDWCGYRTKRHVKQYLSERK